MPLHTPSRRRLAMPKIPCNVAAMGRWQRYWFAEGGRVALAIVRIAVACAVLLSLAHLADAQSPVTPDVYRPVGIWMLLGDTRPPETLVTVVWMVAWASSALMLLGVATRGSTAVSFISAVALAALSFSATRTWSHQYNVVFLAHMALLGSRSGDVLSLDWLVRTRLRKLPAIDIPRGYQWSLRLVQLAVVLMFAGAAFHKFAHGHFTLRWALSDNLRHHLLVKFDLAGIERPAVVDWILEQSWRYRTAALLNMLAQATPLIAVIFIRRPFVRLLAGLMFVTETLLLGFVVDLWNLHWLPLVAVFVDWDWLITKLRRRPFAHPEVPTSWRAPIATRVFIIAFVIYDVITAFVPTLDQRLNTYPFTSFPMFASIRARAPLDEHQPYSLVGSTFEIAGDVPIDPNAQRWVDHQHRFMHSVRNADELQRRLANVLERMKYFYYGYNPRGVRLWVTIFEVPAYPGPARFAKTRMAILGEITPDGTFRTLLGNVNTDSEHGFVELRPHNVEVPPDTTLVYYRDDVPQAIPVPVPLVGTRFDLGYQDLPGNPRYFVAMVRGEPWLVASHETWRWR